MSKLNSLFQKFLSNIEPDEKAVEYAAEAHQRVRKCLEKDEKLKEYVEGSFLYGSYKRHTAVGTIKDVDIVILTSFDPDNEEHSPNRVLRKLKDALARCYNDPDFLEYQRRSIRVDDPLPDVDAAKLTLDIIPTVATNGEEEPLWVPDREQKEWIKSHPKRHLSYTTELNDDNYSEGCYVPLVKMVKWWWKYQCEIRQPNIERPKPKGFWVECLTGENFDNTQRDWADHFIAVLSNISQEYSNINRVPELNDPALPNEIIKTDMTLDEFKVFITSINESHDAAILAREETDDLKSSELWRDIFGEEFPLFESEEASSKREDEQKPRLAAHSHVEPLRWAESYQKGCKVRIDAYLYTHGRRLCGINSDSRTISSGIDIRYEAKPRNLSGQYEVFWQVVNTGRHAAQENGLRGGYLKAKFTGGNPSNSQLINWESTKYTGKHWIQCFIVQDGKCIAKSEKFYVNIRNTKFTF